MGFLLNLQADESDSRRRRLVWIVGFFACCALFGGAKAQDVPLTFPLLLAGLYAIRRTCSRGMFVGAVVLAVLSGGLAVQSLRQYSVHLLKENKINSVFNGVLVDSPDRMADLQQLGIPTKWASLTGRSQFTSDSPFVGPEFDRDFFPRVSPGRIALFYVNRPSRLIAPLRKASAVLFDIRLDYGTFMQDAGISSVNVLEMKSADELPAAAHWKWPLLRAFSVWSRIKPAIMPGRIWFWLLTGLAAGIIGIARLRRADTSGGPIAAAMLMAFAAIFLLVPPICIAGDGIFGIRKHEFLGYVSFDIILLLLLQTLFSLSSRRATKDAATVVAG